VSFERNRSFSSPLGEFMIISATDILRLSDRDAAEAWLRANVPTTDLESEAQRHEGSEPGRGEDAATSSDGSIAALSSSLVHGELVVVRVAPSARVLDGPSDGGYSALASSLEESGTAESSPPTKAEEDVHWVAVELVDEDGAPVRGEPYLLKRASGQEVRGRTDQNGRAYVRLKDASSSSFTFSNLDTKTWEAE